MIIENGIEFHAAELQELPGLNARQLVRVPEAIGSTLIERARYVVKDSVNTELRFVCDAPRIFLYMTGYGPEFGRAELPVRIFYGNVEQYTAILKEGTVTRIVLNAPRLDHIRAEKLRRRPGFGFDPAVIRIVADRGIMAFCGIDTFGHAIRPPKPEEKPAKTCLCYGSSITNSMCFGYPAVLCRRLGMDLINLGLSGVCLMEKPSVDWMLGLDWDCATLELGINALFLTPEEFEKRADDTVRRFAELNKPIFMMTMFPCRFSPDAAIGEEADSQDAQRYARFNDILRNIHAKYSSFANLHLIEGTDVLDDFAALSTDFVHPREYGHYIMGLNLARFMEPFL